MKKLGLSPLGSVFGRSALGALALGLSVLATAPSALAEDKAPAKKAPAPPEATAYAAEVSVLHATNGPKGIDPRIGDVPDLKGPPFSSYKSYELLRKVKLPLQKDDPKTTDLPNGRVLQTKLVEALPDGAVRLSASVNQPGGKTFLPLLEVKAKPGQAFIVAGQSYKGGILVLVIRVVK
jgi:hypothetical protein